MSESHKLKTLLGRYPFVSTILTKELWPIDNPVLLDRSRIQIYVQVADRDLMYRQANNLGMGDGSARVNSKEHPGEVMKHGECIFAVGKTGQILNRLDWPAAGELIRQDSESYAFHVMDRGFGSPIGPDEVEYLVWVESGSWHTEKHNPADSRDIFGEYAGGFINVTVYLKPKVGFEELIEWSSEWENLELDTHILSRGALRKDYELIKISGALDELCQRFYDEVYLRGLREIANTGTFEGDSDRFGPITMAFNDCEHIEVGTDDAWVRVTFYVGNPTPNVHYRGVGGRLPEIRQMMTRMIRYWSDPKVREEYLVKHSKS